MTRPHTGDLLAAARFMLRPLRNRVPGRTSSGQPTWGAHIGPFQVDGHRVVLRSPRLDDGDRWSAARLKHRAVIESWWATSELSWEERHSRRAWVSYYLQSRRLGRSGHGLPLVVEVDGVLVGECKLEWIDRHTSSAEVGGWLDPDAATGRLTQVAMAAVVDHAVRSLGLHRVIAPIAVNNRAAGLLARRVGLKPEGVMTGYLHVGGRWTDHQLLAITAEAVPPEGLLYRVLAPRLRPRAATVVG